MTDSKSRPNSRSFLAFKQKIPPLLLDKIKATCYGSGAHTRSRWVLTSSTSHWAQRRIFRYLSPTFNAQLLHNMAFNSYATFEARISEACDAIYDGWYTSAYDVPIRRLQRRWNGSASKSIRASTNKALTEEQEGAIREDIDRLDKRNMCARPQMIVGAANCKLPHSF